LNPNCGFGHRWVPASIQAPDETIAFDPQRAVVLGKHAGDTEIASLGLGFDFLAERGRQSFRIKSRCQLPRRTLDEFKFRQAFRRPPAIGETFTRGGPLDVLQAGITDGATPRFRLLLRKRSG